MSQLPVEYECPVDWSIISVCKSVAPLFYYIGHTPNLITTEGLIASAYGLYNLWNYKLSQFAVGYGLGYVFDCLDGHFARRYQMTSKFGEYYEHGKDLATTLAYFWILYKRYQISAPIWSIYSILGLGLLIHMGHQQAYLKSSGAFLDILRPLCRKVSNIRYTRFFGCGTFILFTVIAPFYLEKKFSN